MGTFILSRFHLTSTFRIQHNLNGQWMRVSNIVTTEHKIKIERCYSILNIPSGSDQETVRQAFIDLAKRFHPDSGSQEADAVQFQKIETAFRTLSKEKDLEQNAKNSQDFDIKHTAPQHRQYLSYEGVGFGSPAQRQKQWAKVRASNAAINVMEHRMAKSYASEGALMDKNQYKHKHDIKTKYGFDRLVEDLIQEAMSKGEFSNLKGSGEPLSQNRNMNPYVDFVTHKINQILIDNGFTPEWIMLQKDIRYDVEILRKQLQSKRMFLGSLPLTLDEEEQWERFLEEIALDVKDLNKKINKYNLLVPLVHKQMFYFVLDKEAQKVLENGKSKLDNVNLIKDDKTMKTQSIQSNSHSSSILGLLLSLFSK